MYFIEIRFLFFRLNVLRIYLKPVTDSRANRSAVAMTIGFVDFVQTMDIEYYRSAGQQHTWSTETECLFFNLQLRLIVASSAQWTFQVTD